MDQNILIYMYVASKVTLLLNCNCVLLRIQERPKRRGDKILVTFYGFVIKEMAV